MLEHIINDVGKILFYIFIIILALAIIEGYIYLHYRFFKSRKFFTIAPIVAFTIGILFCFSYEAARTGNSDILSQQKIELEFKIKNAKRRVSQLDKKFNISLPKEINDTISLQDRLNLKVQHNVSTQNDQNILNQLPAQIQYMKDELKSIPDKIEYIKNQLQSYQNDLTNANEINISFILFWGILLLLFELITLIIINYLVKGKYMVPVMFIVPALIGVLSLIIYPFFFELYLSFTNLTPNSIRDWKDFGYIEFLGFDNFIRVFKYPVLTSTSFFTCFFRTIWWTLVNVSFHVIGGFIVALMLNRKLKLRGIYRTLILIPWAMPQVIAVLAWLTEFNYNYGFINNVLIQIGFSPVSWETDYTFLMCCLVNIWLGIPFMSVVILGGLQSIGQEYYEAADIDGASSSQKFKFITLPLILPVLTPAVILGFLWTFNNVNVIYLMTGRNTTGGESADILVTALYKAAFNLYRYGFSAAFAFTIFIILAIITFFYMKYSKRLEDIQEGVLSSSNSFISNISKKCFNLLTKVFIFIFLPITLLYRLFILISNRINIIFQDIWASYDVFKKRSKRIILHIGLILCCLITVYPLIRIFSISLRKKLLTTDLSIIPDGANFDSYINLLSQTDFVLWIWNSFLITFLTSIVGVIIAASAAYAFSRFKFPGRRLGLGFLLSTQMIPATMFLLPLYLMLTKLGLLNQYLGLLIAYSTSSLPFTIWTLKGYFDTIPKSIEESAMIDGCSTLGIFYRIIVPLSTPALAIAFLFNFTSSWNEYLVARIILTYPEMYTWPIGLSQFQGQFDTSWGLFSAASIIVTLPILALFLYSAKWLISGMTLGAVKG